jgi:hypothetical protein
MMTEDYRDTHEADSRIARREFIGVVLFLLVLIIGLVYGGAYARRERRDGQTREELRQLKTALEMYYNQHEQYPLEWDGGKYIYTVTDQAAGAATGWYVSGPLENAPLPTGGFDEEYNIDWRVTRQGNYEICGGIKQCADNDE